MAVTESKGHPARKESRGLPELEGPQGNQVNPVVTAKMVPRAFQVHQGSQAKTEEQALKASKVLLVRQERQVFLGHQALLALKVARGQALRRSMLK